LRGLFFYFHLAVFPQTAQNEVLAEGWPDFLELIGMGSDQFSAGFRFLFFIVSRIRYKFIKKIDFIAAV